MNKNEKDFKELVIEAGLGSFDKAGRTLDDEMYVASAYKDLRFKTLPEVVQLRQSYNKVIKSVGYDLSFDEITVTQLKMLLMVAREVNPDIFDNKDMTVEETVSRISDLIEENISSPFKATFYYMVMDFFLFMLFSKDEASLQDDAGDATDSDHELSLKESISSFI